MASKSKRRRRVLRASCILAALIIAGSSFAWFTSKDEVTNRLTANADYNVVAIENFVPPKQFVPGQTVTKEEAVTNTGNVDAFVKQKITADAKVSVEVPTTIAPDKSSDAKDYLKLEEQADWGSLEAGSVLAWKPHDSSCKLGQIIDFGITGTTTDPANYDFNPDFTGLYVFRRAIVKKGGDTADQNTVKNYEYVGYYFVKGAAEGNGKITEDTYFKIYSLNVTDDMLDTETDGLLKSDPTVSYSKKIVTDKVKVDMFYLEPNTEVVGKDENGNDVYNTDYRLKYVFNGQNAIDQAAAQAAADVDNTEVYTNYQQYLDYLQGKTTYVPNTTFTAGTNVGIDDLRALDEQNKTGLNDLDIYDQDNPSVSTTTRKIDLSNFSYKRLEDLKYGTNYDKTGYGNAAKDGNGATTKAAAAVYGLQGLYNYASPKMDSTNTTVEAAWNAAEKKAEDSRQKVNTGVQAAADLAKIKTDVETAIGRVTDDSNTTQTGLKLTRTVTDATTDKVGTNTWSANLLNGETVKDPVAFGLAFDTGATVDADTPSFAADKIYFKTTSEGLGSKSNAVNSTMTADNVLEKRFKDNATAFETANNDGSQVFFTEPTCPTQKEDGEFKTKWNAYVQATKRKMLIEKKIELVKAARGEGGVAVPNSATETNVVRTVEEADRVLTILEAEQKEIMSVYNNAKEAYETAAKAVAKNIETMNTLQALVDTANKEYNTYIVDVTKDDFTYNADTVDSIPAKDEIVINVLQGDGGADTHGQADTPDEDTFEDYLKAAYGTAHKDADTTGYESTYTAKETGVTVPTDRPTYSRSVTENDIKADTTCNNGTGADADGTTSIVETPTKLTALGEVDAVKAAPYWRILQADNMMSFIKDKSDGFYKDYKTAADALALNKTESDQKTDDVVVYIGLGDIGDSEKADKTGMWQYVGDSTKDKAANEFEFGYTKVVGAGETSNKLIEYVKFADDVTQNSFIDMVFDINVGVESAQVVYNGDRVGAQAAQASLRTIIPTQEEYDDSAAVINWKATTDPANPAITDRDPNPKADAPTP